MLQYIYFNKQNPPFIDRYKYTVRPMDPSGPWGNWWKKSSRPGVVPFRAIFVVPPAVQRPDNFALLPRPKVLPPPLTKPRGGGFTNSVTLEMTFLGDTKRPQKHAGDADGIWILYFLEFAWILD